MDPSNIGMLQLPRGLSSSQAGEGQRRQWGKGLYYGGEGVDSPGFPPLQLSLPLPTGTSSGSLAVPKPAPHPQTRPGFPDGKGGEKKTGRYGWFFPYVIMGGMDMDCEAEKGVVGLENTRYI